MMGKCSRLKGGAGSPFRSPTTSLRTGDAAQGGWVGVFFRGACPRKNDFNSIRPPGEFPGGSAPWVSPPGGSPAPLHSSFFTFHLAPPAGELSAEPTEGATTRVSFFVGPCGPGRKSSAKPRPPGPSRPRTPGDFLAGQKVTKEPLKGRGIPISPFP